MTTSLNSAKYPYQSSSQKNNNSSPQLLNLTPSLCFQNIKYFLESYKASTSKEKKIFSDKFINSPLYSENSQIPECFYKLKHPFDRNAAFYIPHGNRRYFKNKNWYPKYPLILSKNCELINKGKNVQDNEINKDIMMKDTFNRFFTIKYTLDGKDSENGPYSASTIYTFLKDYYYAKPPEEQKEMNLLIRDVFDDSFFAPDALFNSLQKEMQQ